MPDDARTALLRWYRAHKRDLPWRRTRDPYAIWVSEIMLQQTRVAAVLEHYRLWMERFPSVVALAESTEAEVLTLWSGLGYYRRARMLHRAAQAVVAEHGGQLPQTAAALRGLPGIGEYTSAAIASIAFGEPVAVVDGNVERITMRLAGLAESSREVAREVRAEAQKLLDPEHAGDSNQAMMELGATVCLPRAPLCLHCPVQPWCRTRGEHATAPRRRQQVRGICYALACRDDRVLLRKRAADDSLMAGMWELPELLAVPETAETVLRVRHSITVTNYQVSIVGLTAEQTRELPGELCWTPVAALGTLPLTGLARKVLRKSGLLPG